jgi:thiol-disulfide isomerase/thioredoxin
MEITLPVLFLILTGCAAVTRSSASPSTPPASTAQPALRDLGPAPELTNTTWLNTPAPLRLANLRGHVVLLEMWTFECINCRTTIPTVKDWYKTYSGQGLVVIGNHFPEFAYEADLNNLKKAVQELGIQYPVAQDNNGATWNAYKNNYWPTIYLIDKFGHIRYVHIGEGAYEITETAIQELLAQVYP